MNYKRDLKRQSIRKDKNENDEKLYFECLSILIETKPNSGEISDFLFLFWEAMQPVPKQK